MSVETVFGSEESLNTNRVTKDQKRTHTPDLVENTYQVPKVRKVTITNDAYKTTLESSWYR